VTLENLGRLVLAALEQRADKTIRRKQALSP